MGPAVTLLGVVALFSTLSCGDGSVRYESNWASLDSRPLPAWYDDAKLGIFIHWGVFSVPSVSDTLAEWFWWQWKGDKPSQDVVNFMRDNYRPDFTYADFAKDFTAELWQPDLWADMFVASGAKYVVFTSKHHEGYTNWPSKYSFSWNSMAVGPKRNLVAELAVAIRKRPELIFGLYHSMFEWFHPLYLQDKANNFTTQDFVAMKTMPELYEIINTYQPEVIWSDGDWEATSAYWNATDFLAWLYNDSPVKDTVVTNDRWGIDANCHHGGFLTCMDRYQPGVLQKRKWENAMTIDKKSWGFRRNVSLDQYMTMDELLQTFIITVSTGGNMLMNVGPTKYGVILPIYEERLRSFGAWLKVNGEGIYSSRPWTFQNDTTNPDVWYTMKANGASKDVYAFVFAWPTDNTVTLGAPVATDNTVVTMLGYTGSSLFHHRTGGKGLTIKIPNINYNLMPCQWVWTFKLTNVAN